MKQRIGYIDAIRAFAIAMVVYMHLGTFIIGEDCLRHPFPDRGISFFFMQLFMFVSGWFAPQCFPTFGECVKSLKNKLIYILLPTVVTWCLWVVYTNRSFAWAVNEEMKWGFWFTFVLFELYIIHYLLLYILHWLNKKYQVIFFILVIFTLPFIRRYLILAGYFDNILCNVLSVSQIVKYYPFFLFGMIASSKDKKFISIVSDKWLLSIGIALFGLIITYNTGSIIANYLGVCLTWGIFYKYSEFFNSDSKLSSSIRYVGNKTMQIYFIHYFIVWGMKSFAQYLENFSSDGSWFVHMTQYTILVIVVIPVCLVIEKILQTAPPLYELLLGKLRR